jgi:putative DNA-invertase from lambdoid prophage Rac
MAAFGEWERRRIAERIRDAKEHGEAAGRCLGGRRPFGYQVAIAADGKTKILVADPNEQAKIAKIIGQRAAGASLCNIAAAISESLKIIRGLVDRVSDD